MNLTELRDRVEVAREVTEVASMLLEDELYTKEKAAKRLIKTLEENDFLPDVRIDMPEKEADKIKGV